MGDQISISFIKDREGIKTESVSFYAHNEGQNLLHYAKKFISELPDYNENANWPSIRREPDILIIDFVRWYFSDLNIRQALIRSGFKLMPDHNPEDHGHYFIDVFSGRSTEEVVDIMTA